MTSCVFWRAGAFVVISLPHVHHVGIVPGTYGLRRTTLATPENMNMHHGRTHTHARPIFDRGTSTTPLDPGDFRHLRGMHWRVASIREISSGFIARAASAIVATTRSAGCKHVRPNADNCPLSTPRVGNPGPKFEKRPPIVNRVWIQSVGLGMIIICAGMLRCGCAEICGPGPAGRVRPNFAQTLFARFAAALGWYMDPSTTHPDQAHIG